MKKTLSHLPEYKQTEIKEITELIRSITRPDIIILYGSFARGDYVEKDVTFNKGLTEIFQSDIDILVIFESKAVEEQRYKFINQAQNDLNKKFNAKQIQSPVSLEWNNIPKVNQMIAEKNPFMRDIVRQGIELFNFGRHKLTTVGKISKKQKSQLANQYFKSWFEKAKHWFKKVSEGLKEKDDSQEQKNWISFHLHQTTEACLRALLYTYTFYYPKTHNIEKLYESVEQLDEELKTVFPKKTKEEKRLLELLRRSYVDARYSLDFEITENELQKISKQVRNLLKITEKLCLQKISEYG